MLCILKFEVFAPTECVCSRCAEDARKGIGQDEYHPVRRKHGQDKRTQVHVWIEHKGEKTPLCAKHYKTFYKSFTALYHTYHLEDDPQGSKGSRVNVLQNLPCAEQNREYPRVPLKQCICAIFRAGNTLTGKLKGCMWHWVLYVHFKSNVHYYTCANIQWLCDVLLLECSSPPGVYMQMLKTWHCLVWKGRWSFLSPYLCFGAKQQLQSELQSSWLSVLPWQQTCTRSKAVQYASEKQPNVLAHSRSIPPKTTKKSTPYLMYLWAACMLE